MINSLERVNGKDRESLNLFGCKLRKRENTSKVFS